jgi:putative FmdB family regulatory protein
MPTYEYRCTSCNNQFEDLLSIAERHDPIKRGCLETDCGGEVVAVVGSPFPGDPWVHNPKKVDDGFRDRLKDIKRTHYGSNMMIPS